MKSLLKNLGLILMIIGAAILVGVFFTGSAAINDNRSEEHTSELQSP